MTKINKNNLLYKKQKNITHHDQFSDKDIGLLIKILSKIIDSPKEEKFRFGVQCDFCHLFFCVMDECFRFLFFLVLFFTNTHATTNRRINIKNASKRMSNYSSCMFILTQLIGFEKTYNGETITLPDRVEIDTLIQFKDFLQGSNIQSIFNDELSSSYEMTMVENNESFWSCNHCTYNNLVKLNTCQMCGLPRNVCLNYGNIHSKQKLCLFCFYNMCSKKTTESFFAGGP